jgi:4-hydroxy-tetrahydrodipicolinate synthase
MARGDIDWQGVMPAIVTPFTRDGALDEAAFCRNIELNIGYGVTGIVVTGCTGEPWALSREERLRVFKLAVDTARGRIKVLAGTGAITANEVIDLARHAQAVGCDGQMVIAPFFPKLHSPDDIVAHYEQVANAVDLPIMLYNVPAYSANIITPELALRLSEIDGVVAIKDSTPDFTSFYRMLRTVGDRLRVFTGQFNMFGLAAIEYGAVGTCSGAPNLWGRESVEFFAACRDDDRPRALALQRKAVELWELASGSRRNLYAAVKAGMNLQGLPGGYPRMPLRALGPRDLEELRAGLARLGFSVPAAVAAE